MRKGEKVSMRVYVKFSGLNGIDETALLDTLSMCLCARESLYFFVYVCEREREGVREREKERES